MTLKRLSHLSEPLLHETAVARLLGDVLSHDERSRAPAISPGARECKRYVDAFGDIGARWFSEGLSFEAAHAKHVEKLNAERERRVEAIQAEGATTQAEIDALQRIEKARSCGMSAGVARLAASIRFSSTVGSNTSAANLRADFREYEGIGQAARRTRQGGGRHFRGLEGS